MERPLDWEGFQKFLHSKTGFTLTALLAIALVARCWGTFETDPNKYPDLESRFRVVHKLDSDEAGILAVSRSNTAPIHWYDNDLVAMERVIKERCGNLSKLVGRGGDTSVEFMIDRYNPPLPHCTYLQDKS